MYCVQERVFWCQSGFFVIHAFTQRSPAPEFLGLVFFNKFSGIITSSDYTPSVSNNVVVSLISL